MLARNHEPREEHDERREPARIRLGMVGGGKDAFIGAVHRIAARIDDHYELVAGALSSTPEKARGFGPRPRARPDRTYASFAEMAKREARRKDGIEAVAIVTPEPHARAGGASEFLEARHPRHLRQAADRDARRGEEAGRRSPARVGRALRAHPQLHRLPDGPAGARDDRRRASSATIRVVQVEYAAGLADRRRSRRPARSRPAGAPTRRAPAPAARPATSAPTPTTSPASSPG